MIYQQWAGIAKESAWSGARAMAAYSQRIGADHDFVVRPKPVHDVGPGSKFYDKFLPLWQATHDQYDHILFVDTDVFPVTGLDQNVFDGFEADVGLCTEPLQPDLRAKKRYRICAEQDERWSRMVQNEWGGIMPRRDDGRLKVYNAGFVIWSRAGLQRARREFVEPRDYVRLCDRNHLDPFYGHDQNWLHAMMFSCGLRVQELDNEWNRYVHYETDGRKIVGIIDPRTSATKMVHIQLRGADEFDEPTLHRIANLAQSEWRLP